MRLVERASACHPRTGIPYHVEPRRSQGHRVTGAGWPGGSCRSSRVRLVLRARQVRLVLPVQRVLTGPRVRRVRRVRRAPAGPAGATGPAGAPVRTGAAGLPGLRACRRQGRNRCPGSSGRRGCPGSSKGDKGDTGEKGEKGDPGTSGGAIFAGSVGSPNLAHAGDRLLRRAPQHRRGLQRCRSICAAGYYRPVFAGSTRWVT